MTNEKYDRESLKDDYINWYQSFAITICINLTDSDFPDNYADNMSRALITLRDKIVNGFSNCQIIYFYNFYN